MPAGNKAGFESTIETMERDLTCIGFDTTSASGVGSFSIVYAARRRKRYPAILARFSAGRK
jgi:hypothetical protein